MPQPAPQPAPDATGPIVAHASTEYRVKRGIIVLMLVGMGVWFAYDGWYNWPRENQRIAQLKSDIAGARKANDEPTVRKLTVEINSLTAHTDLSLHLQKVLAVGLPPLGLFVLFWSLYHSRGQYRLEQNTLHVPGHPPIPLDTIRSIDRTDWDRKGIAYLNYELINGKGGSARLDDFIYQRQPTDEIFARIEDYTGTSESSEGQAASA
jgi:hypothetical protein